MGIPLILQKIIDPFFQKKICSKFGVDSPYWIDTSKLSEHSIIYSGGAGKDISFEKELSKKFNCKIFIFDPTSTGIRTMKNNGDKNIYFEKLALIDYTGKINLSEPQKTEGSFSFGGNIEFPCTSIGDFMKKQNHKKIDLLKIDIEGAEYRVINDIIKNKIPVNQIAVELHHRFKNIGYLKSIKLFISLKRAGYKLTYKHIDDYTFIRTIR